MSDTTSTKSFIQAAAQNAREQLMAEIRNGFAQIASVEGYTLGKVIEELQADAVRGRPMFDTLMSLTIAELRDLLSPATADKPARAKKESTDVKIANWGDAAVRAAHMDRVLAFLTEGGLGEGDHARGFTPAQIRSKCEGNEDQCRDTLKALEEAGKVVFTGDTKGKKYVVAGLKAKAVAAFEAHKAAAEAEKARKEAAKASGEAPKGRKPKAAPAA